MTLIEIESVVGDNTALVVLAPTGVKYTAQCGGMACTHPEAEGYLLNLGGFMQDFDTCEYGCLYIDRDERHQKELRNATNEYCEDDDSIWGDVMRFDDSRITDAQEGWIPVTLNGSLRFPEITFNNDRGWVHNFNCD